MSFPYPDYQKAQHFFWHHLSHTHQELAPGILAYATGLPAAFLNPLWISAPLPDPVRLLTEAEAFYEVPWVWVVPVFYRGRPLEALLTKHGWSLNENTTAMSLPLLTWAGQPPLLDLRIQEENADLANWIAPLTPAFEATPESGESYKNTHLRQGPIPAFTTLWGTWRIPPSRPSHSR
jgi:hypothetical protein